MKRTIFMVVFVLFSMSLFLHNAQGKKDGRRSNIKCLHDSDCPEIFSCVEDYCKRVSLEACLTDEYCVQIDNFCMSGKCQTKSCDEGSPCPAGSKCKRANLCVGEPCLFCFKPQSKNDEKCAHDSDCPQTLSCVDNYCLWVPLEKCTSNDDCMQVDNYCMRETCQKVACSEWSPCPYGSICKNAELCVHGNCEYCFKSSE